MRNILLISLVFLSVNVFGKGGTNHQIKSSTEIELKPLNYVEISGRLNITNQNEVRFEDLTGGEYVGIRSPNPVSSSITFTLPGTDGAAGDVLSTDAFGNLSFITIGGFTASNDNRLLRSDTVGGDEIQESGITVDDSDGIGSLDNLIFDSAGSGLITVPEIAAPSTPAANQHRIYISNSTGKLASKDDTGTVTDYDAGGAGASFTTSNQDGDYTVLDGDGFTHIYKDDAVVTDRTYTLPTLADNLDRRICFKNLSTGKGNLTIDGEGAETIDDLTSFDLPFEGASACVIAGANTWIMESETSTNFRRSYNVTTTSNLGSWTPNVDTVTPYYVISSGFWWAVINIDGTSVSGTTNNITITGIVFANNGANTACANRAGGDSKQAFVNANTGIISIDAVASSTSWSASCNVLLASKPTFVQ